MDRITLYTRVGNLGQEIYAFELPWKEGGISPEAITLTGTVRMNVPFDRFLHERTGKPESEITGCRLEDGVLHLDVEAFNFRAPWQLKIGDQVFSMADKPEVRTEWVDKFAYCRSGHVLYRLYRPEAEGPRPLILFLHGGGECGYDNVIQLTQGFGPAHLAKTYPDCYVMAPQAPPNEIPIENRQPPSVQGFADLVQEEDSGWHRRYLSEICDIIRQMIRDGQVNPKRVYVTGLSMGGAGTLRMLSVGGDLFAAAAPICPTMTPETFRILCGLTHTKLWISAAYVDHTVYRHKYLVDGILALRDAGNQDAKLTIYSPEELAAYDIGIDDSMDYKDRFGWNHYCWILTYHDEHGIISWMMDQVKED